MSDEHADFLNGLHVVENELERVIGELDEMQDRNGIPTLDRVSLDPLQWSLSKLADDLHDANAEIRKARLELASAKGEAELARATLVAAVEADTQCNDALRHELEEVKAERDSLQRQLAEMKGREDLQNVYGAGQAGRIVGLEGVVESLTAERDRLQQQVPELTKKTAGLPTETAPETHEWQVGDEVICYGEVRSVEVASRGYVRLYGLFSCGAQSDWERAGWKLHRKASDVPAEPTPEPYQWQVGDEVKGDDGIIHTINQAIGGLLWFHDQTIGGCQQWRLAEDGYRLHRKASDVPPTPQQVAEFAAVTEPINDSVGTDGEGQS